MKINTITCHNVYNYGASLQAFALSDYLSKLGHDVKIIDYMPSYIRRNLGLCFLLLCCSYSFITKTNKKEISFLQQKVSQAN